MKKIIYIINLIAVVLAINSCKEPERIAGFEDAEQYSIYDYIVENKEEFSDFLAILEVGGIDKTLSAYNPNGNGYTLFLPSNQAIDNFINNTEGISSINDILNNPEFAAAFSRYHVINMSAHTQDFPFGAFPEPTFSEDYLRLVLLLKPIHRIIKLITRLRLFIQTSKFQTDLFTKLKPLLNQLHLPLMDGYRKIRDFQFLRKHWK